jgi:hypothetical protein
MPSIHPHAAVVLASSFSFSKLSVEDYVIGIAVIMAILLLFVRFHRGHDLKRRRAASSGFYDFDVAHYGNSSLIDKTVAGPGSLAPSFVAPGRDGQKKAKSVTGVTTGASTAFADADRSLPLPVPAFDPARAIEHRPPEPLPPMAAGVHLPLPSSPALPRTPSGREDSRSSEEAALPLLVQPPPPANPD